MYYDEKARTRANILNKKKIFGNTKFMSIFRDEATIGWNLAFFDCVGAT
ncbi:hypothetical protein H1P_10027 [Hyella patelloides LEGE 07179]|uniref:Uncharacterized protein n=1 Tax=Hyella patelloides LEGE 07179 TaxID=945734 RepID=A0A563VIK1_9CYAN|nr:hypothetical protein H1P_10027 [Hyella patelloides LEGE 07179]